MGNTHGSKKSSDINNNSLNVDIYDTSWIEAFEKSKIFVWCDASINTTQNIEDAKNTLIHLARVVNRNRQLVHTFNEPKACKEFIEQLNNVCLIISGTLGHELVPEIHNFEQLHSIYIFCMHTEKHLAWASCYQKVRGVYNDINKICDSLRYYINARLSIDYDRIEFDVNSGQNDSTMPNKNQIFLIYSTLTNFILHNWDQSARGNQDMVNYCRNEYTNEYQRQLINDFDRSYSQYDPMWWYTKNYFFQGIINRALRAHDLYALFSMSPLIKDLDSRLVQLNESQAQTTEPLYLYFGQFLSKYHFDRITQNIGGLMCISQFLSANPEKGISVMYIEQDNSSSSSTTQNPNEIRVIFQIYIDRKIQSNVSYANIGPVSPFVHERDYLISMFSVYRIDQVQRMPGTSAWMINITLLGKNDPAYNNLTQDIHQIKSKELDLSQVGSAILNRLHVFKPTMKLFKDSLYHNREELRSIILHYNMGIIYHGLGEYEKSLNEFQNTRLIARGQISSCQQQDDKCLVPIYSNMALVYEDQKQFGYAIDHAFRALRIVEYCQTESIPKKQLTSACYYNLGLIHDQEKKYFESSDFYEHALRIRQEYLPLGHPDITNLQRLITIAAAKRSDSY